MIVALGVGPFEEEALNFVGGIEGVALLFVEIGRVSLEDAANIAGIRRAALVDDFAKDQHFAGAEDIGGRPVECAPVDAEAKIALALRGKSANGRAVEGEIVVALQQELLVVVEHVQPAFEIAEEDGHGLDALFVGEVLEALLLNLSGATRFLRWSFALRFSSSSSSYERARKLRSSWTCHLLKKAAAVNFSSDTARWADRISVHIVAAKSRAYEKYECFV